MLVTSSRFRRRALSRGISLPLSLLLCSGFASSQGASKPLEGHSGHGEVFNEGPRQAAHLLPGCGSIDFAVSVAKPRSRALFNQGMGQLHGFRYFEAERSFRQVAALEPGCAMAYWGMGMANVDNEARARGFA